MLAALLEWFLWLAAFMYCLWKVFKKAEHWTVQLLAVIVGTAFFLLRCVALITLLNLQGFELTINPQMHFPSHHDCDLAASESDYSSMAACHG